MRAGEGGAGGAARPGRRLQGRRRGPPVAARAPQRAAQLGVLATRTAAPGLSHLEGGRGEAGAGARPRPSARLPARLPHTKQSPERKSGPTGSRSWPPGAPCAPRTQHQPRAPTYLSKGAAAAPGESRQTSAPLPPPSARCPALSPASGPQAGPPYPCLAALLPRGRLGALGCCPRLRAKVDGVGGLYCMACPRTRPPRDRAPPRGLPRRVEASLQSAWWAPAAGGGAAAAAAEARLGSGCAARRERC